MLTSLVMSHPEPVLNEGWAAQWTDTILMKLCFNGKNSMGTLMAYFHPYFHIPVGEWRSRANKIRRINSGQRDTNFSSTSGINFLSFLLQNGRAGTLCFVPFLGNKTSESSDLVSQHRSWLAVVGVWITGMFLWWHLGGSKDRLSNTTILVTHPPASPALCYPTVASLTALSCLDAGVHQWHSNEESRLAPSHSLLASCSTWCYMFNSH